MAEEHTASRQRRRLRARRRSRLRRLVASGAAAMLAVAGLAALDKLPQDVLGTIGPAAVADAAGELSPLPARTGTSLARGGTERVARTPSVSAASGGQFSTPAASVEATFEPAPHVKPQPRHPLPADSGSGKRVVFDITAQQVWLVDDDDEVVRTYPVSGSRYDQLEPGTYEVYSTSRHTTSWKGGETMEYMVRFTEGENAAIGFHDIPLDESTGEPVQALSELGTPLSDGCIRQDREDARALWDFAPVGTTVVVTGA